MAKDASGGRSHGWIPVTVAVVAIATFMAWLALQESPQSVAVQEPGETASGNAARPDISAAEQIDPAVLVQSSSSLIGQMVDIPSINVQDQLGPNMFWIELPGSSPYLVRMDSTNIRAGAPLPAAGTNVRVVGVVKAKDTNLIANWGSTDPLNEDEQLLADFGGTYIEAVVVESATGS